MSGGLSKLGSALIAVFSVCLLLLAAELLYVLCRRRRFQRRSAAASASASAAGDSSSSLYVLSSKELLYFFCWKNQSARIGPNEANVISINGPDQVEEYNDRDHDHHAVEIDDVMKIHQQGMYGQSRLLFTIKEEEEADHDHDHVNHDRDRERSSSSDGLDRLDGCDGGDDDDQTEKTLMSSTVSDSSTDDDVAVAVLDEATPFSTPCGSPPYYTPSPSPSREELKVSVHDSYCVSASSEKVPFVSVEIIGV